MHMLRFVNSLLVIVCAGVAMLTMFMIGQGLAHHQGVMDVVAERWYLLAGFAIAVVLAMLTRGRKRPSYED